MNRVTLLALCLLFSASAARAEDAAPAGDAAKSSSPEERLDNYWHYLKDSASDSNSGMSEALEASLSQFVERNPDAPMTAEAEELLGRLQRKHGDDKGAMMTLLRLVYEHPDSRLAVRAKSDFLDLGRRLSSKLRPALSDLIQGSDSSDRAQRMAAMLEGVVHGLGDALYDPTARELRRFAVRYPDYAKMDRIQFSLAELERKAEHYPAAVIGLRGLLLLYPDSELCPKTLTALADIHENGLRDYKKATEVYQEIVDRYPQDPQALVALQRSSALFDERLRQYDLSIQMDEKIVSAYPKTDASLAALQHEARLYYGRLGRPREAIKTDQRIADAGFSDKAAVDALETAANIARKDLKDYELEIQLRSKIGADFPNHKDAPGQMYEVAEVYESDLHDIANAIRAYRDVSSKYIDTKYGDKARDRANKLR